MKRRRIWIIIVIVTLLLLLFSAGRSSRQAKKTDTRVYVVSRQPLRRHFGMQVHWNLSKRPSSPAPQKVQSKADCFIMVILPRRGSYFLTLDSEHFRTEYQNV